MLRDTHAKYQPDVGKNDNENTVNSKLVIYFTSHDEVTYLIKNRDESPRGCHESVSVPYYLHTHTHTVNIIIRYAYR